MARKLIVISGNVATGKTTMGVRLEHSLNVPLLTKDDIKEMLFDKFAQSDRAWSKVQGKAAIAMMFAGAKELLLADTPLIIESLFHPELGKRDIQALLEGTKAELFEVYCDVEYEERVRRWQQRTRTSRHRGHQDDPVKLPDITELDGPLFPEQAVRIDTGVEYGQYEEECQALTDQLQIWLKGE